MSGNVKLAMSHVVPDLVQKVLKGQDPLHILGTGEQVRHYTYGGDLARGIVTAMEHPAARNDDFNLSTAQSTTVLELAETIWRKIKGPDEPLRVVSDDPFEYDVQRRVPATEKAKRVLGFEATTTLDEMLDEVIPWIARPSRTGRSSLTSRARRRRTPGRASARRYGRSGSRRPPAVWWIWGRPSPWCSACCWSGNAFLFSAPEYEDADMGANSILIEQARRFALLVGNYSREKFNHPGPAFLYVQAWGESLFYDALHVVPTAVERPADRALRAERVVRRGVVAVGYGWTRSVRGAAAALAVVPCSARCTRRCSARTGCRTCTCPPTSPSWSRSPRWRPGAPQDAWIAALSGWFLIHGHACFLLFVPVLARAALAALPGRGAAPAGRRGPVPRPARRVWLPVAVISAVFALPIVVELALHWPGNFGKYFAYSVLVAVRRAHRVAQVAALRAVVLVAARARLGGRARPGAVGGRARLADCPAGPLRRFCWPLLAVDAVSTSRSSPTRRSGSTTMNQYYIGYFYWSAPVIVILVIAVGVDRTARRALAGPAATGPWPSVPPSRRPWPAARRSPSPR